jgi:hypothetical protein
MGELFVSMGERWVKVGLTYDTPAEITEAATIAAQKFRNLRERQGLLTALSEMGYGDARSVLWVDNEFGWGVVVESSDKRYSAVPRPVAWAASELVKSIHSCWPCCVGGTPEECRAGRCAHPDEPRWPPRELLINRP